jgi:predicted ABC-type ATPase
VAPAFPDLPFINADMIQRDEMGAGDDMKRAYEAARIADERRAACLSERRSFVTESVFSHPSKLQLLREAKAAGFTLVVIHVGVDRPETSVARVEARTLEGGHNVPEDKVRERFERNKPLIREAMLMADYGMVYDNSRLNEPPEMVLGFEAGRAMHVAFDLAPAAWARELYFPKPGAVPDHDRGTKPER